jgi:hypothetical protein
VDDPSGYTRANHPELLDLRGRLFEYNVLVADLRTELGLAMDKQEQAANLLSRAAYRLFPPGVGEMDGMS